MANGRRSSDELLAGGIPTAADSSLPKPIDVREDYVPPQGQVRYFDGDELDPLALSVEDRARLQNLMDMAGLIPKGTKYRLGVWDGASQTAFKTLLGYANAEGVEWETALDLWAMGPAQTAGGEESQEFDPKPWLRPDPARLAMDVESYIDERLQRKATPEEKRFLAQQMLAFDRADYENETAMDRLEFTANQQGEAGPGEVEDVDAAARFQQFFNERYKNEIEMREGVNNQVNATSSFLNNVFAMDQEIA